MTIAKDVLVELKSLGSPKSAEHCARFFKTGPGEYGEGDIFIGLTAPQVKAIVKKYRALEDAEILNLLRNKHHEARSTALLIWAHQYAVGNEARKQQIIHQYLNHATYINNWDLVDVTCHKILGDWVLRTRDYGILYRLSKSKHLWSERISVVSCYTLIKNGDFTDFIKISESFLTHKHDLMHKAVGWMLRELGKKDECELRVFLDQHAATMPRTALRYALERMDSKTKKHYMELSKK